MGNRFGEHKPDPAIKKNVIRARRGAHSAKRMQGHVVVAASLAATIVGWATFSQMETLVATTDQLANPTPVVASARQAASSSPTPLVTGLEVRNRSGLANVGLVQGTSQTASVSATVEAGAVAQPSR